MPCFLDCIQILFMRSTDFDFPANIFMYLWRNFVCAQQKTRSESRITAAAWHLVAASDLTFSSVFG